MSKRVVSIIVLLIVLLTGTCHAATYTLPEKMSNQLAIGSGLKGTFTVAAEGEKFDTPFLKVIRDAEWSVRGILSGKDLHYYVFQSNDKEEQSALSELYRKDGTYYFRSDMVQGKILAFPVLSQIIEAMFPVKGENGSSSSFIARIMELPESTRKEKWEPVLQRYQNELEMWLADFTVKADTVKLDSGLSALDFSYEIPMGSVYDEIVKIYGKFAADQDVVNLLSNVMTDEEKQIYLNGNLLYFYLEALQSLEIDRPVKMSKRVSAIGDLLLFRLELPLDERTTGYQSVIIETISQNTFITLSKTGEVMMIGLPDTEKIRQSAFEQSVWFARVNADPEKAKENIAVRIDIKKSQDLYDKDEKSHENDHYDITVIPDTSHLPDGTDLSLLTESEQTDIKLDLHYSSKYAQNSATTLEISADITQGDAAMQIRGKFKTAAPWLFMPFEIIDPIQVGTDKEAVLDPYFTDWISNADSMIHHGMAESATDAANEMSDAEKEPEEKSPEKEEMNDENAETEPLDIADQE